MAHKKRRPAQKPKDENASPSISHPRRTQKRPSSAAQTSITIIGPGRLGTALARALAASGYRIDALVSRNMRHAKEAAKLVQQEPPSPITLSLSRLEQLPPSDILFITTSDDAIAELAAQIAVVEQHDKRRIALHTSGALSSEALAPLRSCGFHIGSMHPLVSVSEPITGAERLRGAFYCIEGDQQALSLSRRLVRSLNG